jgi:YidC/Oxa1 family membrane protein insertase
MGGTERSTSPATVRRVPRKLNGNVRYAGVGTPFFVFGVAPKPTPGKVYDCNVYPAPGVPDGVQVDLIYPQSTGDGAIHEELVAYFGPKYLDKLEGADKIAGYPTGFKDSVDFGWFGVISRPLLWLLRHIFYYVGNWGIAIILLTMVVKLATLYWTHKSMKSMRAMAALKPEMDALQKKYPDDRQKQQQAQMELFKRHGVNPLSGCLPMLLQMPIWMGLYRMLSSVGELHQAVFIPGWLDDLTMRDPYYILPIALTGLMFLQSRIQPATGDSMQQKMIMYGMPLMFGVMGLWFPSGLTVYITTNTVLGILHSLYMKRSAAKTPLPASKAVAATDDAKGESKPIGSFTKPATSPISKPASSPLKKPARPHVIDVESSEVGGASDDAEAGADGGDESEVDPDGGSADDAKGTRSPGPQRRGKRRTKRR